MKLNKKVFLPILLLSSFWLLQCEDELKTSVVTAQVVKTLATESNTATVVIGRTSLYNAFIDQPSDTSLTNVFPISVEPITGASVKVNQISLSEKVDGVYFNPTFDLQYRQKYDLCIATEEETITGSCLMPGSFSILMPTPGDSVIFFDTRVIWTRSESTEHYIVSLTPTNNTIKAQGWDKGFPPETTSCLIPSSAFMDTAGNFYPGQYTISMISFNGAWKKGSLDLFLSGGNLTGGTGIYGAAVYAKPVIVNIIQFKGKRS